MYTQTGMRIIKETTFCIRRHFGSSGEYTGLPFRFLLLLRARTTPTMYQQVLLVAAGFLLLSVPILISKPRGDFWWDGAAGRWAWQWQGEWWYWEENEKYHSPCWVNATTGAGWYGVDPNQWLLWYLNTIDEERRLGRRLTMMALASQLGGAANVVASFM